VAHCVGHSLVKANRPDVTNMYVHIILQCSQALGGSILLCFFFFLQRTFGMTRGNGGFIPSVNGGFPSVLAGEPGGGPPPPIELGKLRDELGDAGKEGKAKTALGLREQFVDAIHT
jgi:hypothetical protein